MLPLHADAHPERESDRDREPGRAGLCRDRCGGPLEAGNEPTDAFPVGLAEHLAIDRRDRFGQRPIALPGSL
jgi:hypothetical protein